MPRRRKDQWKPFPCDVCGKEMATEDDFGGCDYRDWMCRVCYREKCGDGKTEIEVLKDEIAELKIRLDQMEKVIRDHRM